VWAMQITEACMVRAIVPRCRAGRHRPCMLPG
jgi:hypothetical protein